MAVPFDKKSRSRSRMRRAANMRYRPSMPGRCAHCGEPKMPHFACGACGVYQGRQVREVVES